MRICWLWFQVLAANERFALFRSNTETTENHLMTIPKKHVTENASKTPKELVRDLVTNAIRLATENDPIFSDLRFNKFTWFLFYNLSRSQNQVIMGFHAKPTVSHLHCHLFYPKSEMSDRSIESLKRPWIAAEEFIWFFVQNE